MLKLHRIQWALLVSIGGILSIGCGGAADGPRIYTVNGTVTFTGKPLAEADLLVTTADGKHAAGTKVTDGKFVLKAPAGLSKVEITALRDIPGQFQEENPGERVPVREQFIPSKYTTESTLTLEIKPDVQDVKFDLEP
jgi:hypothetical protein